MPTFQSNINSQYRAELIYTQLSQDVANNRSRVRRVLQVRKLSGSGYWTFSGVPFSCSGGPGVSDTWTYDFTDYTVKVLDEREFWVDHDDDGKKSFTGSASVSMASPPGGTGTPGGTVTLTTIPRATQPSVPSTGLTLQTSGGSLVISTPRASSGFTHTLKYKFGSASGTIATNVGTSYTWNLANANLLAQIPDKTSATGTITCETYDDGDLIGTKTVSFTVKAGSTIIPSLSGITLSEAVSAVASTVGAYVQSQSKLTYAMTGVAGIQGSSIEGYALSVAGTTYSAASGTTNFITTAGTVAVAATVTDSRGRSRTVTVNITVLAWTPPQITNFLAQRCLSDGTLDPNGTYLKVTVAATVSSLTVGTEKNTLTYKTRTRERGTTTWTDKNNVLHGSVSLSSSWIISSYSDSLSWDARVEITDRFATSAAQTLVSVGAVLFDWGPNNVGIGKYWENGTVDIAGDVYLTGHVVSPFLPYSMAQGRQAITPSAPDVATGVSILFPVGRFTVAPRVQVTAATTVPGSHVREVSAAGASSTGVTLYATRADTTTFSVDWTATQMTPTSADG